MNTKKLIDCLIDEQSNPLQNNINIRSFIHSGQFYSASSNPLLLGGVPDYSIDTVSELTHQSATGNSQSEGPRPMTFQT